jgi:hypothetical protein
MSERLEAAQRYAAHGWPVFPCAPGEKVPVTRRGFLDASTDPDRICSWWKSDPDRNVAIATGTPGPDVVDVDQHGEAGNGFAAWNRASRAGMVSHPQAIIRTPSGGMHAYFTGTGQRSGKITGQHLDFRARGGYVLAPPSAGTRSCSTSPATPPSTSPRSAASWNHSATCTASRFWDARGSVRAT